MLEELEIEPSEAARQVATSEGVLVDVREPEEFEVARLESSSLIPMRTIPGQLRKIEEMAKDSNLLILCHHGVRSLQVVAWLRGQGITRCYSIAGGIDRWSLELDRSVPRY